VAVHAVDVVVIVMPGNVLGVRGYRSRIKMSLIQERTMNNEMIKHPKHPKHQKKLIASKEQKKAAFTRE